MLRQFAGAWLVVFAIFALLQAFRGKDQSAALLAATAVAGIIGIVWPRNFKWLFIAASLITFPIGWVLSNVLLALIFFFIITPIGLALRLRGRDELQLRRARHRTTFWVDRRKPPKPENYLKQY